MASEKIKVLIVDDHQLMIDGVKSILEGEEDVEFAGGAVNMEEGLAFLDNHEVDVVLADINLPGRSGIEVAREVKEHYPEVKVIALTMHEDIEMVRKMVEAGASGFLLKRANMNDVLEAIRTVAKGGKYLDRDVQAMMMENISNPDASTTLKTEEEVTLTRRELEILTLVAKEFTNERIAEKLFISERTVETHRRNIFSKTKTKSVVGLIKYAIRN
ncbi:MAG: DNA-binding response regulator, partial [Bacteroidetes bacterium]